MRDSEILFANKVRQALDQNVSYMSAPTAEHLASARQKALQRKRKNSPRTGWLADKVGSSKADEMIGNARLWTRRFALAMPVIVTLIGVFGIYQFAQQSKQREIADTETQLMSDELPLAAYLDQGFSAYLEKQQKISNMDTSIKQSNPVMRTQAKTS
jgi:hypothetical protein